MKNRTVFWFFSYPEPRTELFFQRFGSPIRGSENVAFEWDNEISFDLQKNMFKQGNEHSASNSLLNRLWWRVRFLRKKKVRYYFGRLFNFIRTKMIHQCHFEIFKAWIFFLTYLNKYPQLWGPRKVFKELIWFCNFLYSMLITLYLYKNIKWN